MQYIGPSEVLEVKPSELKTPLGYDVLEVTFKDKSQKLMSKKAFDKLVGEVPGDLTDLRERMTKMIVGELLVVLAEWNPKYEDIAYILQQVATSNNENLDEADSFLYGVEHIYDRTMLHVQKVMKDKNAKRGENINTQPNPAS